MIGSHDTFTYLKAANPIFNIPIIRRTWRTQCAAAAAQYQGGVRFFDVRVCRHRGHWYFCHGLARLKGYKFASLTILASWMEYHFPNAIWRLVLERGGKRIEEIFTREATFCSQSWVWHNLWMADIKKHKKWNGEIVNRSKQLAEQGYTFAQAPNTWTVPCYELHGTVTARNFYKIDLRKEARRINNSDAVGLNDTSHARWMSGSDDCLYLLDYSTNEY